MGAYLNPGNMRFQIAVNSEIFVDKSEMIGYLNSLINTNQRYVSVTRPRRFGKSMAADMLCAYYGKGNDSRTLFENCKLAKNNDSLKHEWDKYLGKFDVIRIVMTDFLVDSKNVNDMIDYLSEEVISELKLSYPDVRYGSRTNLRTVMTSIYDSKKVQFVVVIDEWDAIFREYKENKEDHKRYLEFLRDWLKDKEYIALAYMTGILPIKKYGKHSALNMFDEYSMTAPMQMSYFAGFTQEEVQDLCVRYGRDYKTVKEWYDGYILSDIVPPDPNHELLKKHGQSPAAKKYSIFNPLSVVKAMRSGIFNNYWNETETYEALKQYIDWNFEGLKEDITILMNKGNRIKVDITGYQNDMTTFHSKDDILTMLIHLGYLGYQSDTKEIFIPNNEVLEVFKSSTANRDWAVTFKALENSQKLLEATWNLDEETVASLIEAAHDKAGNKTYHSEMALSYAVQLAYYAAQDLYTIIPELDTGKGFADLTFIPKKPDIPAMLVEFKYEKTADTAMTQIINRNYPDRLHLYKGNLILVGINYVKTVSSTDIEYKHHSCEIRKA